LGEACDGGSDVDETPFGEEEIEGIFEEDSVQKRNLAYL